MLRSRSGFEVSGVEAAGVGDASVGFVGDVVAGRDGGDLFGQGSLPQSLRAAGALRVHLPRRRVPFVA